MFEVTRDPTPEDLYVLAVIQRHRASPEDARPERVRGQIEKALRGWRFRAYLEAVKLSGSHPKSTALRDSDMDLFLSLSPETPVPLREIQASLAEHFCYSTSETRNVSVRIRWEDTAVDLVPGRRRTGSTSHSLWQPRLNTWLQTDIAEQIRHVRASGVVNEVLALKIWQRRRKLRWPGFLLELAAIRGTRRPSERKGRLAMPGYGLSNSFLRLLRFLATDFPEARLLDPANSNNAVSDLLSSAEKLQIATAAGLSSRACSWPEIL